jgi:hypothetical protein
MIDPALASFLQQGIAINIGTRDAKLSPSGARVSAVVVEPSGTHLVAYLPKVAAPHVLPNLEANRQAALVFVRPTDDRSCQVKGEFESARPATARERPIVTAQWDGFMRELEAIGIPRAALAGWVTWPSIAIRLRATAIFDQTPGPDAGRPLP